MIDFNAALKWGGGGVDERPKAASERAKRVSEPTIGGDYHCWRERPTDWDAMGGASGASPTRTNERSE